MSNSGDDGNALPYIPIECFGVAPRNNPAVYPGVIPFLKPPFSGFVFTGKGVLPITSNREQRVG